MMGLEDNVLHPDYTRTVAMSSEAGTLHSSM